ncbi:MAG TPA: hypothetical protein VFB90_09710, partial [Dehalococcoidia bacterium]|nr:hypothetical protein [Dehalococcoidia bacterium]
MNREYLPHIAAVARAILDFGFRDDRFSLSLYRTFKADYVTKKRGQSYETDAEFYAEDGSVELHIEAKRAPLAISRIVKDINESGTFNDLPLGSKKELEYVLDVAPRHLWLVAPGSVDPNEYVYALELNGLQARFRRLDG